MNDTLKPPDFGPERVPLYSCDGDVIPIHDFVKNNPGKLHGNENSFLKDNIHLLNDNISIPDTYRTCLSRSIEIATEEIPVVSVQRSGARSAFDPETNFQLKGCRPLLTAQNFPAENLSLGETKIKKEKIPFGIMTEEAILREVLGFCFMEKYHLPVQAVPVAVILYRHKEKQVGYGMLLQLKSETRIESYIELPHCTVRDLIEMQMEDSPQNAEFVVGSEIRLNRINLWKYVENKGRILSKMNWNGGFRGILNSNIGNDVLINDKLDEQHLALTDFDTFWILENIPADETQELLDTFILQCLVEVAMGSLPIMQYTKIPSGSSHEQVADILGAIYFKKSSLWRSYYRHFLIEADARGISPKAIRESIEKMRKTEAFTDILRTSILSNDSVKSSYAERPFYYPHN